MAATITPSPPMIAATQGNDDIAQVDDCAAFLLCHKLPFV